MTLARWQALDLEAAPSAPSRLKLLEQGSSHRRRRRVGRESERYGCSEILQLLKAWATTSGSEFAQSNFFWSSTLRDAGLTPLLTRMRSRLFAFADYSRSSDTRISRLTFQLVPIARFALSRAFTVAPLPPLPLVRAWCATEWPPRSWQSKAQHTWQCKRVTFSPVDPPTPPVYIIILITIESRPATRIKIYFCQPSRERRKLRLKFKALAVLLSHDRLVNYIVYCLLYFNTYASN